MKMLLTTFACYTKTMKLKSISIFIFGILFSFAGFAQNSSSLVLKNADSMIRNDEKKIIELKGNVELIFKQQYLSCDRATIYLEKKQLEAAGNVILGTSSMYAEAEKLFFNYKTNQGVMYKAWVQSGKTSFTGDVIYKTGENDYQVEKANYTTCVNCSPSWSFSGSKIDATFGEYAKIQNSFFKIKDIPVFWFPYFIVPLKSERQSGLLAPIIESSNKGGLTLGLNYYYVHSDSSDSLYTITNYANRGQKYNYHYRYALSPLDSGEVRFGFLKDKLFGTEYRDTFNSSYTSGDPINRWSFQYSHRFELPRRYIQRTQLFWVSDSRYPFDFPLELSFSGYPSLENHVSLTKNSERANSYIEIVANRNLLKEDPLDTNADAVHRFPEIQYTRYSKKIGDTNLYWNLNSSFSNFARPDRAYDNDSTQATNTDQYDAGSDIIRAGHRVILAPSLLFPIKKYKYVDILPKLNWQSNLYQFGVPATTQEYLDLNPNAVNEGNSAAQHKLELDISMQTRFSRIFEEETSNVAYKHEIKPSISYRHTPWVKKDDHSFLNIETEDFLENSLSISGEDDALQFDYNDQMFKKRSLRIGVQNFLTKRIVSGEEKSYSTTFFWDLYQSYDFEEKEEPLSDLTSITRLNLGHYSLGTELHYYPYKNITNSNISITYNAFTNSYITIGYENRFEVRKSQALDEDTKNENIDLKLYYSSESFRFGGKANYSLITNDYAGFEFGLVMSPPGECWRLGFTHTNPVSGAAVTKAIFEFLFDGKKWVGDDLKERLRL